MFMFLHGCSGHRLLSGMGGTFLVLGMDAPISVHSQGERFSWIGHGYSSYRRLSKTVLSSWILRLSGHWPGMAWAWML